MPRGNKIVIRTGSAAPSASDFVTSEPAWDSSAGKLWIKNASGSMVAVGGGSSLAVYSSVANFPATGSSATLYLDESTSRLYQWESPVYVEVGVSGGGAAHAATHAANGTDALTLAASQITGLGSLATANSVAYSSLTGTPSSFAPTTHASSHASGGSDALTIAASQITGLAAVATSGSYNDLTNKPSIPSISGLVSSGTITAISVVTQSAYNAISSPSSSTLYIISG
jgi:hypothetical protein